MHAFTRQSVRVNSIETPDAAQLGELAAVVPQGTSRQQPAGVPEAQVLAYAHDGDVEPPFDTTRAHESRDTAVQGSQREAASVEVEH